MSTRFPLEETAWTDYYLGPDGALSRTPPGANGGSDQYIAGSPRQSWSYQGGPRFGSDFTTPEGPDELDYRSDPLADDTAIAGPITATLHVSSTTPDTEVFVQLVDEAPDGSLTYLQRGMLRASHRAVDPSLSDWAKSHGRRVMYRPYHPHAGAELLTPRQVYELVVEVFPVSHVFREGHRILLKIHTPPAVDSYYAYARRWLGVNTVYHDADRPSRVMLRSCRSRRSSATRSRAETSPPSAASRAERYGVRLTRTPTPPVDLVYGKISQLFSSS